MRTQSQISATISSATREELDHYAGQNQFKLRLAVSYVAAVEERLLGFATVSAVKRSDLGIGFEVGFAIVAIAMILDRTTQAIAERLRPPPALH